MGKGGGGGGHTPVEAKESGRSKQLVKIVEVISEGEVYGLADGMKSIYFDKTPVQNKDGSYNFKNVQIEGRVGGQVQDLMAGFNTSEKEVGVGTLVKKNLPITRTVTDNKVSRLRLTIGVQSLFKQEDNGDTNGASVNFIITIGSRTYPVSISGKYSSQYLQHHTFDNLPSVPFIVKVERTTDDSTTQRLQNNTIWSSYTEIIDTEFAYPNTALMGVKFDSEYFSNIPTRTYDLLGLKVKVPSNYDTRTRQYTGIWDGTFKVDWTDNPAWVLYDVVTNKRYGLGGRLGEFGADKWALYQVAQYCDQLVPDGFGGQEPRFTCNVWLTEQRSAYQVINDICSIFRAMPVWNGQQLTVVMDRPADPVWTYTNANVDESGFSYTFSARKSRHNAIQVEYADKENSYEKTIEYVSDDESIRKNGLNVKKITAFGCTSRGQAHRTALWLLQTEKLETKTVTFTVGAEGLMHIPGDIIKVADTHYAGTNIGGRVLAVNGKTVTLDREITISGNSYLSYINANAKHQNIKIISVNGAEVTLDQPPVGLEIYGVWSLATQQVTSQLFKALSVKEESKGKYTIMALQHEPQKEAIVDNGAKFEPVGTTVLTTPQISNIGVTVNADGSVSVDSSVTGGNGIVKYDIRIYKGGVLYDVRLGQQSPNLNIDGLENGDYSVLIQVKNENGQLLSEKTQTFTINKPPAPTGIRTTGGLGNITLEWDWVDDVTATEIFASETDDIKTAKRLTKVTARMYTHEVGAKQVRYYWLRHARGVNVGPFNQQSGIKGESAVDIDAELDVLNKKLSQNIVNEVIDTALPARNLELIKTVSGLNTGNFIGHNQVYNTVDGKLYIWNGREYTTKVQASDLSGKVSKNQLDNVLIGEINSAKSTADTANSVAQQAKSETTSLSTRIQSEANTRGNAITQLQNVDKQQAQKISALTAKAESALSGLETEKTARANGDRAEANARETLTSKVNNAESAINEIKSTKANKNEVASLAQSSLQAIWKSDTKAELDKLQVGGRNLLLNTADGLSGSGANNYQRKTYNFTPNVDVASLTTLTLSCNVVVKGVVAGDLDAPFRIGAEVQLFYTDGTNSWLQAYYTNTADFHGRVSKTITLSKPLSKLTYNKVQVRNLASGEYKVDGIKLEVGNVATDWTPAPEDAESSIANVSAELTNYQKATAEKDKAQAQQITALTSSVASAKAEVQSVSRTVADVNGKLSATHTIKTQAISGGKTAIAGISLGANKEESSVIVMADKFQVVPNPNGTPKPIFKVQNGKAVVAGDLIADGEVTASKLATNSVTTGALQAGAVRAEHMAAGQVTADKLAIGLGGNLLYNPIFSNSAYGWRDFNAKGGDWSNCPITNAFGRGYHKNNYHPKGEQTEEWRLITISGTQAQFNTLADRGSWVDICRQFVNVVANKWYIVSAYVGGFHCAGQMIVEKYNADENQYQGVVAETPIAGHNDIHNKPNNFINAYSSEFANGLGENAKRIFVKFKAPDTGKILLVFRINKYAKNKTYGDFYLARPMLQECVEHTLEPSPWVNAGVTAIHGGSIVTNSITAQQMAADSVTANQIATGAVAAKHIAAGSIGANHIATRSLTADKLNVTSISSISADLGVITGGSLKIGSLNGNFGTLFEVQSNGGFRLISRDASGGIELSSATRALHVWDGGSEVVRVGKLS